ncbi:unnamed protein product [Cylindrotheca closterium]|uniref:High light inducible protein n=1 Tax=Cylindrotheca closterium TaxID=2856 RepID=A0AAD2CF80_9STRA|nr:unnamed protein product [Cylindrotheca closterium]
MYSRTLLLALLTAIHCEAFVVPQSMSRPALALREAEDDEDGTEMNPDNPNLPALKGDFDWDEKFGGDDDWITENVPGKVVLGELELAEQSKALAALESNWRKEREIKEFEESRKTGWTGLAELANGRFAMFFLVTGLLTELWTGVSIPGQVEEMLRIGGFIGFD